MNEDAADSKGMKWALRLVAPFCLVLVLLLAWQEHEMAVKAKLLLDFILKGEPLPYLTSFVLTWTDSILLIAVISIGIAMWCYETQGTGLAWGLSLGLATFLVAGLFPVAHFALHKAPFFPMLRGASTFIPPPPELQCSLCKGFDSHKTLQFVREQERKRREKAAPKK